jgi:peptidoglycan/xylan/chitin deacetylase (PgdA/CDA1 family)
VTRWCRLSVLLLLAFGLAACSGPDGDSASAPPVRQTATTTASLATPSPRASPTPAASATAPPPAPSATSTATPEPTATSTATATATTEPTATSTAVAPIATSPPPTATWTPTPSSGVITIRTAETTEKIVALTFDAGADRGYAAEILDILQAEGVTATFGMTGRWAEENPDLIVRMVREGHMLMNHTMTHRSWTGASTGAAPLTSAERADELHQTEEIVAHVIRLANQVDSDPSNDLPTDVLRPYFRPPYGDYDDSVIADLQDNGYTVNALWTIDSLGWNGLSSAEITARVLDGNVPGAIHLFHVGAQSEDAAALPAIVAALRDQGYRFVTIADMVAL